MIIKCSNCGTKFSVPKEEIAEYGRMVGCSVCDYEWLYVPDGAKQHGHLKFEKKKAVKAKGYLWNISLLLLLVCVIFLVLERNHLVKQNYYLERFYAFFNYHNLDGIETKINAKVEKNPDISFDGINEYLVPIILTNTSDNVKFIPRIHLLGIADDGSEIHKSYHPIRKYLSPDEEFRVVIKIRTDKKIDEIMIFAGNDIDLSGKRF